MHVCGKALIVKNGEGLGRFQPDFCGHRRQHGVVRQVPAICEVSRKDGWFKVAQGRALGVVAVAGQDEFDTLGLGRWRSNDDIVAGAQAVSLA